MAQDILVVVTNIGRQYLARSLKESIAPQVTKFAVGDGYAGLDPNPDATQLGRMLGSIRDVTSRKWGDDDSPHHSTLWVCDLQQNAGFIGPIYEIGLFTVDGSLVAHGTFPTLVKTPSNSFRFNIIIQF